MGDDKHMIDTILFDLDGTLLQFTQDEFMAVYFAELKKVFVRLGLDAERTIKALWAGTNAMVLNDGKKLNSQRFWETFSNVMDLFGERLKAVDDACESFYSNEFDNVKHVVKNTDRDLPRRLVDILASKGFSIALATNPLFPTCAVTTRLGWIGLSPQDFCLVTDYANSSYCKPSHNYYRQILRKINKEPRQCLMIGNNTREDMSAGALGAETFLVTDYLENEANMDISAFRHGTLAELEAYITSLPNVNEVRSNA